MKKFLMLLVSLCFLTVMTGCAPDSAKQAQSSALPRDNITVTLLDVGQAESILLQTGGKNILIDTGLSEHGEKLVASLKERGVKQIDILVATHPHADHIGGMTAILENFKIQKIYDTGLPTTSKIYQKFLRTIKEKKIPFSLLRGPSEIEIGDGVVLQVLSPQEPLLTNTRSDLNANSAVMRLVYQDFTMMLAGDATSETEERLLQLYPKDQLQAKVLKVAHHTSRYSNTAAWLTAVSPEAAIASYGSENEYGFPHKTTLKRIAEVGAKYYNTAEGGNVKVTTDGKSYQIKTDK